MTFARCIVGEPDPFHTASPREMQAPRLKMRDLLPWTRSNQQEHSDATEDPTSGSAKDNQENHAATNTASPKPRSYRKGEKSFLDFHQNYAITKHLGEGSYSTVKQVTHRTKGGKYACKIVDKLSLSPVDRVALGHEVKVLQRVDHEHIMKLHEVIEDDIKCYLIMELAEHGDLFDRIVKQGKFAEKDAQKVVGALVEALHYCHLNSIIHRDVKPENVLLSGENVKLCDFGFAKQLNHMKEQSIDSCGTPGYAAPEILDGKPYGVEVDVFSLGVVTYIMLCGYPPFPMKLSQLRTHRFNVRFPSKDWATVDTTVKELICRMLSVKPQARPSMEELRDHPWVKEGKEMLDDVREKAEARRKEEELQRKQEYAEEIRKKLVTSGLETVKHGRSGLPHRTKLRLSPDGRELSWQSKLLKRGLLRYQSVKGLTSFFTTRSSSSSSNNQDTYSDYSDRAVDSPRAKIESPRVIHPSVQRVSSLEESERRSEPTVCEDSEPGSMLGCSSSSITESTTSSQSSSTSDVIREKRMWWRAFRLDRKTIERSASGSLSPAIRNRFNLVGSSQSTPASPTPMGSPNLSSPRSSGDRSLDSSILLTDVTQVLIGDQCTFFTKHHEEQQYILRREKLQCVMTIVTHYRELHLEFSSQEIRDGFAYFIQVNLLNLVKPTRVEITDWSTCVHKASRCVRERRKSSTQGDEDTATEAIATSSGVDSEINVLRQEDDGSGDPSNS